MGRNDMQRRQPPACVPTPMITPDDISWTAADAPPRASSCPVCGSLGPHAPLLDALSMAPPHAPLTFLRCPSCGSGHFDPPGITDFSELGQTGNDFWRFYVEVGGGVWETVWPILAERRTGQHTLLDVGCGFGFAVDYWQRMAGGDAIGVELADYGQIGARLLGIKVYNQLLQDIPELHGRRFDIVYASEVIEHVPDPAAFVALLAQYVADDGVLVLTTPSAEYIQRSNHSPTLHAALSPGFHGFLLSAQAFGDAVRRNGFAHVDVRTFGERQILWASRAPLAVDPTPSGMLPAYLEYLGAHVAHFDGASPVWQGMAYRYVKDCMNTGRPAESLRVSVQLLDAVEKEYGSHVRDPAATAARIRRCAHLHEFGQIVPYFMPGYYFFMAAIAHHVDRDLPRAERLYQGTIDCTLAGCRFGSAFFLEAISLIWPARMALADLCVARGDIVNGAKRYARIAAEGGRCMAENGYAIANQDMLEVRIPAIAENLLAHGHVAAAGELFAGYRTHIHHRYGDALTDIDGVDQALTVAQVSVPEDPLFAPAFAAVLARRLEGDTEENIGRLVAVAAVATRWSSHPKLGARMAEHAKRIEWLLPASHRPKPAFSFSMNYAAGKRD